MRIILLRARSLYTATVALTLALVIGVCAALAYPTLAVYDAMPTVGEPTLPSSIVILDAGHGGEDCGAIGANGVYEKDLNLWMAEELGAVLRAAGYTVLFTRTEDKLLYRSEENIKGMRKICDLRNRCAFAKGYPEALFVSLHMNAFGDARYDGLQVYHSVGNDESVRLANAIRTAVTDTLQPDNRRAVKSGEGIYILEHIDAPTVLIECGFLTNEAECERLCDPVYRHSLAEAIGAGILSFQPVEDVSEKGA